MLDDELKKIKGRRMLKYKEDAKTIIRFFALLFLFLTVPIWLYILNANKYDLDLIIITTPIMGVIVTPLICFLFSKLLFRNNKIRFLLSFIPPFLISFCLLFRFNPLFVLVWFAWCELWSLLGAMRFKFKFKKKNKSLSASNQESTLSEDETKPTN